jgi:5'-nucleotidase
MRTEPDSYKVSRGYFLFLLFFLLALAGNASAANSPGADFTLTILHLNDTHSHLEPSLMSYSCGNQNYKTELGGFSYMGTAVSELRQKEKNLLFLHGGDIVQGTLYFTRYQGQADIDLLNGLGLDAATLGNHDFDLGTAVTAKLADAAAFPFISANVDASQDPVLAGKIKPYFIKSFAGEQIAIIGATTPYTAEFFRPGSSVSFEEVVPRVAATVREIQARGINKIILLTHIGYKEDLRLARTVPGIDVIVGGHSHTLLGGQAGDQSAFRRGGLRLNPAGDYPTVVSGPGGKTVLVVQAWEWGKILGNLKVFFDEKGEVKSWQGNPILVAGDLFPQERETSKGATEVEYTGKGGGESCLPPAVKRYKKDSAIKERLAHYAKPLDEFQHVKIATAARVFKRGDRRGPGHLVAESMLWKTRHLKTRVALQNVGGIRCDIPAGDITVRTVYELLPFANTVNVLDLTGRQLRRTLEEMIRGQIADGRAPNVYAAGLEFRINRRAPFGWRVTDLRIKDGKGYDPVGPTAVYRVAVQNYLAGGGDGCQTLKRAKKYRYDTGFVDAEVFMEYLKQLPDGVVANASASSIFCRSVKNYGRSTDFAGKMRHSIR